MSVFQIIYLSSSYSLYVPYYLSILVTLSLFLIIYFNLFNFFECLSYFIIHLSYYSFLIYLTNYSILIYLTNYSILIYNTNYSILIYLTNYSILIYLSNYSILISIYLITPSLLSIYLTIQCFTQVLYEHPPEIEPSAKLPKRLEEKLDMGHKGKLSRVATL